MICAACGLTVRFRRLGALAMLLASGLLAPGLAWPQEQPKEPAQEAEGSSAQSAPLETVPLNEALEQEEEPIANGDSTRLDDITVTSSKRVKAQRDLPGNVGAIQGEQLEKMGAQELSDYLKLIPGVSLADGGPDQRIPVIRGIASATRGTQSTAVTTGIWPGASSYIWRKK